MITKKRRNARERINGGSVKNKEKTIIRPNTVYMIPIIEEVEARGCNRVSR